MGISGVAPCRGAALLPALGFRGADVNTASRVGRCDVAYRSQANAELIAQISRRFGWWAGENWQDILAGLFSRAAAPLRIDAADKGWWNTHR